MEPSISVILPFRTNKIVFIGDIEKECLQISFNPEHRDFVKTLWYENVNEITSENILQSKIWSYCICRVLFGVTSSPFLLTSTINKYIEAYNNEDPKFLEHFLRLLNVDNLNSGS